MEQNLEKYNFYPNNILKDKYMFANVLSVLLLNQLKLFMLTMNLTTNTPFLQNLKTYTCKAMFGGLRTTN